MVSGVSIGSVPGHGSQRSLSVSPRKLSDSVDMGSAPWRVVLGDRVKLARKRRRWSLRRAEDVSGVPRSTWAAVEAGEQVKDYALLDVAAALGWPAGECFRIMADALAE